MQDSKKNNLLQVADYIVSGIQRGVGSKKGNFLKPLKSKEIDIQIWLKQ